MAGRKPADPFERPFALRNRQNTAIKKAQGSHDLIWDPWPVKRMQKDAIFDSAQKLVQRRNSKCVNICVDRIVLLPASGNIPGVQGGSTGQPLYSIRLPGSLPVRVHLWKKPIIHNWNEQAGRWDAKPEKLMVRRGQISEPLVVFLRSCGRLKAEARESDFCKHYSCWKGLKITDEWLHRFPDHLRSYIEEIWFSFNGFRFFGLPPELREAILEFAIGSTMAPLGRCCHYYSNPLAQVAAPKMEVALVNKQLHQEVMPVVFAHTILFIQSKSDFIRLFRQLSPSARDHFFRGLRFVEIDMAPKSLLQLFGINIMDRQDRYHYIQHCGEASDLFTSICLKECALKKIRIKIPHISTKRFGIPPTVCQQAYCTAVWSGARPYLRNIPFVEFGGYIDEL